MKLIYSGICDIGLKREENQDSICMYSGKNNEMSLFVVADGMGGHAEGEIASRTITDRLMEWSHRFVPDVFDGKFSKMMKSLENKIEEISREIYHNFNQTQICGSTCVLLFIYKEHYGIINIGDSRIYKKERWKIKSIMKDDVWENRADIKESMSQRDITNHVNYGKLLQAVGTKENILLSCKTDLLKSGDCFLLCSDGLYKFCTEKEMYRILKGVSESNIDESVKRILAKCYEAGAKDNISIIVVKCV